MPGLRESCWHTNNHCTGFDIGGNNSASTHNRPIANGHAWKNDCTHADPYIVSDHNWGCSKWLPPHRYAIGRVSMVHAAYQYAATNQAMIANCEPSARLVYVATRPKRYFRPGFHPSLVNPDGRAGIDNVQFAQQEFSALTHKNHCLGLDNCRFWQ